MSYSISVSGGELRFEAKIETTPLDRVSAQSTDRAKRWIAPSFDEAQKAKTLAEMGLGPPRASNKVLEAVSFG